jgi:outer membrane protein OmpU
MKKLLIATTALVATAGVAAAEVTISGNGRMGVVYNLGGDNELNFTSRVRASISMSGTTDGGLEFGGSFGVHDAGDRTSNDLNGDGDTSDPGESINGGGAANGNSGEIYISGAFGRLSMGDVDNAAVATVGHLAGVGLTGLGDNNEIQTISTGAATDDPRLLYTYSAGSLTFALSATDGKAGKTAANADSAYAVGVKYAFGDYSVALAYENRNNVAGVDPTHIVLGVEAGFGSTKAKLIYGMADYGATDARQVGLSISSTFDATTVSAYVRRSDIGASAPATETTYWGIGASYDLGGGAKVVGGVAGSDGGDTTADLGLSFSF